jgi:hypothetical protein
MISLSPLLGLGFLDLRRWRVSHAARTSAVVRSENRASENRAVRESRSQFDVWYEDNHSVFRKKTEEMSLRAENSGRMVLHWCTTSSCG